MIQDIYPHIFINRYNNIQPEKDDYVLYFNGRNVLLKQENGVIDFPRFREFSTMQNPIFLFSIDDTKYFLILDNSPVIEEFDLTDVSIFRTASPLHLAFAGITAHSLYVWYSNYVFCGKCGDPFQHHHKERMLFCSKCNNIQYPCIAPAVIIGVTNGDKLLLSKYSNREYTRYALLAGFAETGETIEQTVIREVKEEVGLNVKNPVYFKSQPWGFSNSLLLGFFVELDGDEEITLDEEELSEARWFERNDIPPTENNISLTSEMIEYFRNSQ